MGTSKHIFADTTKPQLVLSDKLSIFSDKAYRKNNGKYFEAVGNVVIIKQKDTVYGELATLNQETMMAHIEGNVRLITLDMTLYGSHLEYNIATGGAVIKNARILTSKFNLVADRLIRISENEYLAEEAEFTTCKDCAESWSVYGKRIRLVVGKYVQISHGMAKIKGVNVLYIPYMVLPILSGRKTGLLFPSISTRLREGMAIQQPFFWAIDDSKDATISPTFWAKRGWGSDLEYRQRFTDMSWFQFDGRGLKDTLYSPGQSNNAPTGKEFFRYFTEVESHQQWTPNLGSHFRYTGARDLDVIRDNPMYTDRRTLGSDMGLRGFMGWRRDRFSFNTDVNYARNQLFSDPLEFDKSYVQVMPRVGLSTTPYSLIQTTIPMFQHVLVGMDGSFSRFRQVKVNEGSYLRNADRISVQPYLVWHFFTWGPVGVRTKYLFDQQSYVFDDNTESRFGKNAGLLTSEVSFTMDRIFGLAYQEKIPLKYISPKDLKKLRDQKEQGLTPLKEEKKENRLVGHVPEFQADLAKDTIIQLKNSYRHSQEYKFIHHYIASGNEYGNTRFNNQLNSFSGWFDYEDAIRSKEFQFGSSATRTIIPPSNTIEMQWNNSIISKTPKVFNFYEDNKYLRDNFSYSKIGFFNVSQGYLLNAGDTVDFRQKLTRLLVQAGYNAPKWSVAASEAFFHYESRSIFNTSFTRRFDSLNVFGNYNYATFGTSALHTVSFGGQVRPIDTIGLAMVKDINLNTNDNMRTLYSIDLMPNNNCWIFSLNYRESLVDHRYTFNIMFNFGDDNFEQYKTNYFAMRRL